MRVKLLFLFAFLAGCGVAVPVEPFEVPYRNPTQPVASKALFDYGETLGEWHVVARFPDAFCETRTIVFDPDLFTRTCADGERIGGGVRLVGPGRLQIGAATGTQLWVLWADHDYRTMVLADPDGRRGWILNRTRQIPADRMVAAREILDFNGYDLNRLVEVPQ